MVNSFLITHCFFIIVLFFPSSAISSEDNKKLFNAESYILDNGMEIVLVPSNIVPAVTHMVWYKVGAADEPVGKSGIAHFFEHLMFKGSKNIKPGEFSKTVKSLGGNDNAFTSQDYTAYYQSVPSAHLEKVMRMEADRMNNLNPPMGAFVSEKNVIIEERNQRTDNNPRAKFMEHLRLVLFPNHPYSIPVIGWKHEIEDLDWKTAKDFYDKYYAPNNAILVISGDMDIDITKDLIDEIYGSIPKEPQLERIRTKIPPLPANVILEYRDDKILQPFLIKSYRVPSTNQNPRASLSLQILEELMGGGPASRLYGDIVIDKKLASSVSVSYSGQSLDDSSINIYSQPIDEDKIDQILESIEIQFTKLIEEGISEQELNDTKTRLMDASIYARDSLSGPAMIIGSALSTGNSLVDIEYWPQAINSITEKDIIDTAKQYLSKDNKYVVGRLLAGEQK